MKNYYRQFVTLLQERPGHAMPGKQAVGRIVIEARDNMARATVYIQDLSPQSTYKLAFISRAGEGNLGVVLGSIIVDERGRFEGKFEFDRANIGGSTIACEGIDACVVILGGSEEELAAPLAGYRSQPFSWRVNLGFADGKEESPILEVKQLEEVAAETETESAKKPEKPEEAVEAEEVPAPVYDFVMEEQASEAPTPHDVFQALFQEESTVEIFGHWGRFPKAQWIVTTLQSIEATGEKLVQNPLVRECCQKHRHILLGRNIGDMVSTYVLGIPDIYDITLHTGEHEFNSLFDSFKLCNPSDPVKGAHGYWLKQL
jgi:hypothetical protein